MRFVQNIFIGARYLRIWVRLTLSSFQTAFVSRFGAVLFTVAKFLRFGFFFLIIMLVLGKTNQLAGYTLNQVLMFFITFNIIDTLTQLLFRDVYRFRPMIVSGDFDLILIKPMSPLFRVLLGGADPLDLVTIFPYLGIFLILIQTVTSSFWSFVAFLILILNAFLIAAAFHILVLALGILTTEIDHMIMIYRDLSNMARFPIDIYREPLRGFITFVVPVGVMMTFPPKALFGLLSPWFMLLALVMGIGSLYLSLRIWKFALTQYTSASS